GAGPGRAGLRADDRPGARGLDHRARRPVLLGELPRRDGHRQVRPRLSPPLRLLPRDPALPRLAEPPGLPFDDPASGPGVPFEDRPRLQDEEVEVLARLVVVAALFLSWGTAVKEAPDTTVAVDVIRTRPTLSHY